MMSRVTVNNEHKGEWEAGLMTPNIEGIYSNVKGIHRNRRNELFMPWSSQKRLQSDLRAVVQPRTAQWLP